jgi:hypothetical protein
MISNSSLSNTFSRCSPLTSSSSSCNKSTLTSPFPLSQSPLSYVSIVLPSISFSTSSQTRAACTVTALGLQIGTYRRQFNGARHGEVHSLEICGQRVLEHGVDDGVAGILKVLQAALCRASAKTTSIVMLLVRV